MARLPHKISVLIYAFNRRGELLMLHRREAPNAGRWSPCGGKLEREQGESPHQCAAREAREEIGGRFKPRDFHLAGLVAERAYEGNTHWLMFIFELKRRLGRLPPPHPEGRFEFVPQNQVLRRDIPATDREIIWPLFLEHRGGFFTASIACHPNGRLTWEVEETSSRY